MLHSTMLRMPLKLCLGCWSLEMFGRKNMKNIYHVYIMFIEYYCKYWYNNIQIMIRYWIDIGGEKHPGVSRSAMQICDIESINQGLGALWCPHSQAPEWLGKHNWHAWSVQDKSHKQWLASTRKGGVAKPFDCTVWGWNSLPALQVQSAVCGGLVHGLAPENGQSRSPGSCGGGCEWPVSGCSIYLPGCKSTVHGAY